MKWKCFLTDMVLTLDLPIRWMLFYPSLILNVLRIVLDTLEVKSGIVYLLLFKMLNLSMFLNVCARINFLNLCDTMPIHLLLWHGLFLSLSLSLSLSFSLSLHFPLSISLSPLSFFPSFLLYFLPVSLYLFSFFFFGGGGWYFNAFY